MIQKTSDILMSDNLDEALAEASRMNGGILIVFCKSGSMQVMISDERYMMNANELFICMPSSLVGNYMRTPDFQCMVLFVSGGFLEEITFDCFRGEPMWLEKRLYVRAHPVIKMDDYQLDLLTNYYNLLSVYLRGEQDNYRKQVIRSLVRAATLEVMSYLEPVVEPLDAQSGRSLSQKDSLLYDFLKMLRESEGCMREVQYYATKLCITPKHLSAVCKERSGKTASQWIAELTLDRVKHLLLTTDMTVKEVAFQMGFNDVSFFCQYVRKHLGVSPLAFRRRNR